MLRGLNGSNAWRTAFAFGVVAMLLWFFYWLESIILLALVAVLVALLLDVMARVGIRYLKMPRGGAVVIAAILFVVGLAATLYLLAVPILTEVSGLMQDLPRKMTDWSHAIEQYRKDFPWLRHLLPSSSPNPNLPQDTGPRALEMAKSAIFTASTAFEWSARLLAAFFLAIFLAWDPQRWLNGIAGFWPKAQAAQIKDLLQKMASALRSYLFTMAIYIVAMGSLWSVGLWLIGIDYALLFGVIGGLVEVVPYIGPLIGLIPPLLFALTLGPLKVSYVIVLYIILHIVEGYILVPYLLHQQERLPPPLIVLSILAFGTLFGALGVIVAVPLGIFAYVWAVEMVYKDRGETG